MRNVRGMRKGTRMVKWCNVLSIHRLDLERLALRDGLLFPHKKAVEQEEEVIQVACHVEDGPPLHEPHVLWILLVADYEADACNLF